ncbi:MAG: hypothetical protein Q4C70_10255, partial [Planctomycetia bacterium]|nr:hypothetical protein [Planctomycetia bacterium]
STTDTTNSEDSTNKNVESGKAETGKDEAETKTEAKTAPESTQVTEEKAVTPQKTAQEAAGLVEITDEETETSATPETSTSTPQKPAEVTENTKKPSRDELIEQAHIAMDREDYELAFASFQQLPLESLESKDLESYATCCETLGCFYTATQIREQQLTFEETEKLLHVGIYNALEGDSPQLALMWVEKLLEIAPEAEELLFLKGIALNQLAFKNQDSALARRAIEVCNQLIEKNPENSQYYATRSYVYLKNPAYFPKAFDLAKADMERALSLDSKCMTAQLYHGIMLRDVYQQKLTAVREFEALLQQNSENVEALLQLGITFMEDRPELALDYFTRYIKFRPEKNEVYEDRGKLYFKQKQYENALADFNFCISHDEMNLPIRKLRAETETHLERWRDAKSDYDFLIANDSEIKNHIDYYLGLADVYDGAKQKKRAQDAREAADKIRRTGGI